MSIPVLGVVLAGGKSRRMGRDKALLRDASQAFMESAIRRLLQVTDNLVISGGDHDYSEFGYPCIMDEVKGLGPLAGMVSVMHEVKATFYVFMPVDNPLVPAALFTYMVKGHQDCQVSVPLVNGHYEPLCAVYHRDSLSIMEEALATGQLRMKTLITKLKVCPITEEDIRPFGDPASMFLNINDRSDYQRFKLMDDL